MEKLNEKMPDNAITGDTYHIRNTYMLMLVGAIESPLGPRRETVLSDYQAYGDWQDASVAPTTEGNYLLAGHYINSEGDWPLAILPCWFQLPEQEWECLDGYFKEPKCWMEIPWLPEIWAAAVADHEAVTARHNQRMAQIREVKI